MQLSIFVHGFESTQKNKVQNGRWGKKEVLATSWRAQPNEDKLLHKNRIDMDMNMNMDTGTLVSISCSCRNVTL